MRIVLLVSMAMLGVSLSSFAEIVSGRAEMHQNLKVGDKSVSRVIIYAAGKKPKVEQIEVDGVPAKQTELWLDGNTYIDLADPGTGNKKQMDAL